MNLVKLCYCRVFFNGTSYDNRTFYGGMYKPKSVYTQYEIHLFKST